MPPSPLRPLAAALSLAAVTLGAAPPAAAGPLQVQRAALAGLVRQGAPATSIDAVIDAVVDYPALAQASLGRAWAVRSAAEQTRFTEILTRLVRCRFDKYAAAVAGAGIQSVKESPAPGGRATVSLGVGAPGATPVAFAFDMHNAGGTWTAVDVVTDGVSLVDSYRGQFTKIIRKDGFAALVTGMNRAIARC